MAKKADAPDVRQRVYDAVRRYPGIHLREIERQIGVSAPLAQYHLKKLVEAGFVDIHEQGGYARHYPTDKGKSASVTPADLPIVGLLREEVPLHVVLVLLDKGPMTHTDLVAELQVAKSTLSYHLAKLAEAEVVERAGSDARLRLKDRERMYRLLLAYRPTPSLLDRFAQLWEDLYG